MKELGITEKTDRAKVKELIEKAQLDKQEEPETDGAEQNSRAAAELAEARAMAEGAVLEAVMLAAHVKADKVSKAVNSSTARTASTMTANSAVKKLPPQSPNCSKRGQS